MTSFGMHNLFPPAGSKKTSKRLGRGNASGKGTTAGKGTKGQRARQGGRKGLRGLGMKYLIQSTPKLGGFVSIHKHPHAIQVEALNALKDGMTVSVKTLADAGLVPHSAREVKLIGSGKVRHKYTVKKILATESARKSIISAGGTIE